jgi:hypothetical protein
MAKGCLAAIFGVGLNETPKSGSSSSSKPELLAYDQDEGDVHSGPGGYEGPGYSGGYAADYYSDDEDR